MGAVNFRYVVPPGLSSRTIFRDTLQGVDQPFMFGDNWINALCPGNAYAATTTGITMSAGINRGANGITLTGAVGGPQVGSFFPIPLDYARIINRNQFAEVNYFSATAVNTTTIGPSCFDNSNAGTRYNLAANFNTMRLFVNQYTATTRTVVVAEAAGTAFAFGDICRLEVDITTTPGTTIVRIKKNGTVISTLNDNSGSRLVTGIPGVWSQGADPATSATINTYAGGKL